MKFRILLGAALWTALITLLHIWANVGFGEFGGAVRIWLGIERRILQVGYLPVTCHLTCPVVDWTTRNSKRGALFESRRYTDWPTLCEEVMSGKLGVAFILAPMAMSLKQRGTPIRIVYLGHRDGTAMMVAAGSRAQDLIDLRGERIAVPSRYSNQYLWLARMLEERGMTFADVDVIEVPPPDMPAMLEEGNCAAYITGEPFAARTEYAGTGRVLYLTKDEWPDFISCVVVAREELIASDRALVQELVDGIASSGLWLDQAPEHRVQAAELAGKYYYRQDPRLLQFVLEKPPDRVKYTELAPAREDLDEIMQLAVRIGVLPGPIAFEEYADPSFADHYDGRIVPMPPPPAPQSAPLQ